MSGLRRGRPMKRGKPLQRGKKGLRRDGEGARRFADQRSRIRQRSAKEQAVYDEARIPYLRELQERRAPCEIGPRLIQLGIAGIHCGGAVQCLHERRKSSSAGSKRNRANLLGSCIWCNGWIEDWLPIVEAELEMRLTLADGRLLVVREGDPEWAGLSRRADRVA